MTELYQVQRTAAQKLLDSDDERVDDATIHLFLEELDLENQQVDLGYAKVLNVDFQDTEVMEAYTQQLNILNESILNIQNQLAERMGANSSNLGDEGDADIAIAGYQLQGTVEQSGTQVSIEELFSYPTQEVLPAIAAYFCKQQFSNIRYDLEDPSEIWAVDD